MVKKKLTESRPLNFRLIQPVIQNPSKVTGAPAKKPTHPGAILMIEEEVLPKARQVIVNKPAHETKPVQPALQPQPIPAANKPSAAPVSSGKLGSLAKLRQQVSSNAQTGNVINPIIVTEELLHLAWNEFIEKLKAAKNPAVSSFELAELRVNDHQSFTVISFNNLQQKFIDGERIPLSEYLQERFHNRMLTYQVIIEQREELNIKVEAPLNARERFNILSAQFPLLKELKDRLKLELDY